jgi:NOL1/NOP2/fmu family ribosome biogenesis protein
MMDGSRPADKKGKDLIPLQAKALSTQLDPSAYTTVEVSYQEAIGYLRKEALTMPADTPRGEVLLTYQGQPLGFVKNIGNRANNLYPAEWKIKSTHVPENVEIIRL